MKPITKTVIFLVVAFIIVIIITIATNKPVEAPVTASPTPTASSSPAASVSGTVVGGSYTLAQVATHKSATDCWTAVGDSVYNLTPFINQHPGGVANITKICGVDGTATFTAQHGSSQNAQKALASLKIGSLTK